MTETITKNQQEGNYEEIVYPCMIYKIRVINKKIRGCRQTGIRSEGAHK